MNNILITGVSSGIGHETALKFLRSGDRVFGSVRKEEDARSLSAEFGEMFVPLLFDITDEKAIGEAREKVAGIIGDAHLHCLINNAGMSVNGPMAYVSIEEFKKQFDINIYGLIRVTQIFLPLLGFNNERKKGKIINIGSAAGRVTRPFMGPYAASKHAVEAISDAWRRELMAFGIDLVLVEPGPIKSKIWSKAKQYDNSYADTPYAAQYSNLSAAIDQIEDNAIPTEQLANLLYTIAYRKKNRARYLIAPKKWMVWLAIHVFPDRMLDKMFFKQLKKLRGE
ncbi:SDR family NAD(P)-dependent oxidoreductase [Leptobacterium flavescens]|uniref:SDR family NAD(P)-dependent oxidoreductase n=1 Tax=Leptobacterium flavescens TaxID=472055 RepID=A0A6P0UTT2_9FLAO|nr:SDR family oxidoreductase [Leptobacterium flavescens]NER13836.1 SDR family NAD(P)-dependent oxidoreductase [Leptobacterium flavescens]